MNKESNVGVGIPLFQVERSEQQMNVVNPHHILLLLDLNQVLCKNLVDLAIGVPHLGIFFINLILIVAFEVVEKWPQKLFIIKHELLDLVLLEPNRVTILALKQVLNPNFFIFVVRNDSWPANPLKV